MTKTCKYCSNIFDEEPDTFELRIFRSDGKDCEYFDLPQCLIRFVTDVWGINLTKLSTPKVQQGQVDRR